MQGPCVCNSKVNMRFSTRQVRRSHRKPLCLSFLSSVVVIATVAASFLRERQSSKKVIRKKKGGFLYRRSTHEQAYTDKFSHFISFRTLLLAEQGRRH